MPSPPSDPNPSTAEPLLSGALPELLIGDAQRPNDLAGPPLEDLAELFPELELDGVLGQGGMGTVYLGRQPELGRTVALKLIAADLIGDGDFETRFAREARALASVSHPHIVAIHQVGERDGVPFLLLEHIDGQSLRSHLSGEELESGRALRWMAEIADALGALHGAGLVHRDLKPENVLIRASDDAAVLIDFGLAKPLESPSQLTGTGALLGTPAYLAPEVWEDPRLAAPASDLYALGVVLFEALTGTLPVGRFDPPQSDATDPRATALCMALLSSAADDRPRSAGEVADALREAAAFDPLAAPTASLRAARVAVIWATVALSIGLAATAWVPPRTARLVIAAVALVCAAIVVPSGWRWLKGWWISFRMRRNAPRGSGLQV